MNEIEKNEIKDVDRALDYLTPSTIPLPLIPMYRSRLKALAGDEFILNAANTMYYQDHIEVYTNFFLKYLTLAGEHVRIISIDRSKITIANLLDIAEHGRAPMEAMPNTATETWLYINSINSPILEKYLTECYMMTDKYIVNTVSGKHSVYIRLGAVNGCAHLDELYRAFCAYL